MKFIISVKAILHYKVVFSFFAKSESATNNDTFGHKKSWIFHISRHLLGVSSVFANVEFRINPLNRERQKSFGTQKIRFLLFGGFF